MYSWPQSDNKHYRGLIDRIFVSLTEWWEVDYYVAHYLQRHNSPVTPQNRAVIHGVMDRFPGRRPIQRTDMDTWLDSQVSWR